MQLCKFLGLLALTHLHISSAQPTRTKRDPEAWGNGWSPGHEGDWGSSWPSQCTSDDLSNAQLPTGAPTPLPRPSGTLSHVAIGRGVQNYTCDMSDPEATPVAIGALATLYDVSCIAATDPTLLSYLPNIAYALRLPSLPRFESEGGGSSSPSSEPSTPNLFDEISSSTPTHLVRKVAKSMMIGHHFFLDDTTPRFDLDTDNGQYGCVTVSKTAESDPPSNASPRSVPWLYLTKSLTYSSSPQAYSEVYRVNTVGGNAPATCKEAKRKHFRVQYSAEYWFYT